MAQAKSIKAAPVRLVIEQPMDTDTFNAVQTLHFAAEVSTGNKVRRMIKALGDPNNLSALDCTDFAHKCGQVHREFLSISNAIQVVAYRINEL